MFFDPKLFNVVILGFSFMLVFTAFQTGGMIEKVVITGIKNENPDYNGSAYNSLAVIYAVFALSNWIAPSVITFTGPKVAMLIGAVTYALFIANFLYPMTWGLYFASALIGVGAAFIWTGQGNFLTINSDTDTISRNSGIFWALLQCSLLFGNIFVFMEFQGEESVSRDTRQLVFGVLTAVAVAGLAMMLLLRTGSSNSRIEESSDVSSPLKALIRSLQLLKTSDMLLLSVTFFYTGLELSFFSGVYGTCLGFTKRLGDDSQKYVGISGMLIGIGEIVGGASFGILGKKTNRFGRDPIILLGYLVHMVAFFIIFINLPPRSPIENTYDFSYIKSDIHLALLCSFLLGFGDSCFNTQVYSILGFMYPDDSAPAFALFKFMQSLAAASAFFYSDAVILPYQLLILAVLGTLGSLSFLPVEWKLYRESQENLKMRKTPDDSSIQ